MSEERADLEGRLPIVYNGKSAEEWYTLYCQEMLQCDKFRKSVKAIERVVREEMIASNSEGQPDCDSSPLLSVDGVTLGEQPFGTSHWAGTWHGFPAVSLSYYRGATLLYFDQQWKKIGFRSLTQLHEAIGVNR